MILRTLTRLPALLAIGLVLLWQRGLSRLLPPSCRFYPSCSHYGVEALRRFGLVRGGWLALWRVLRCNPWGGMGHDPVPEHFRFFPQRGEGQAPGTPCRHRHDEHITDNHRMGDP